MNDLTLTAGQFRRLVTPVLPCVGTDAMLPVLTAMKIETRGKWLLASGTDRFKLGVKRIECPEGEWPEFSALVPARAIRNIMSLFKPMRHLDPEITLSVDKDRLTVSATGGLDMLAAAQASYYLEQGEFPKLHSIVVTELKADPSSMNTGFNWKHLSAFTAADGGGGLSVRGRGDSHALLVMGEDFIGFVMPRKFAHIAGDAGWGDLLAVPAKKPARAKKLAAV